MDRISIVTEWQDSQRGQPGGPGWIRPTGRRLRLLMMLPAVVFCGCSSESSDSAATESNFGSNAPSVSASTVDNVTEMLTANELRRRLKANSNASFERSGTTIVAANLLRSGVRSVDALEGLPLRSLDLGMCSEVTDLTPLKGMPLQTLILENTAVADLSPLEGMQLEVLYLQNTPATDLNVVRGMPLRELNLLNVAVSDVTPFAQLPLETLWVPGTRITDLSPLKECRLVSLDIQDTAVSDLTALSKMTSLKRLNIGGTPVTDVSALADLSLERITLSPQTIRTGIEVLRNMPTLTQIRTDINQQMSAEDFWQRFDLGVWNDIPAPEEPRDSEEQDSATDAPDDKDDKETP